MPMATKLYFAQIAAGVWADWVKIVNVSNESANVQAVARNMYGNIVWTAQNILRSYQAWIVPVDPASANQDISLVVSSNKPIVGERHCHLGTEVLAFPGASVEAKTVGTRLFFPEVVQGCADNVRFFNITENYAFISVIVRDISGFTFRQFSAQIVPMGFVIFTDQHIGNVQGTLEAFCTQPAVGERHLHYGNGVAVGQLAQILN